MYVCIYIYIYIYTHTHTYIHYVHTSFVLISCKHFIHSVTSSYTVSHHHTQCHIIIHSVTSSYTVSHHHTLAVNT